MDLNIEKLVERQVALEVSETDIAGIVKYQVREIIANGVGKEIIASIGAVAKHMIAEEVRKALDGEVVINDGWGNSEVYPSFEELFRKTFKKAMDEKYEVKREIEKQVAARVQALVKQDYTRAIEKIVDEISGIKLAKKDKEQP